MWEEHQEGFLEEVVRLEKSRRGGKEEERGPVPTCRESASREEVGSGHGRQARAGEPSRRQPGSLGEAQSQWASGFPWGKAGRQAAQLWFNLFFFSFLNVRFMPLSGE